MVAADQEVRIDCALTVAGPVYAATKFRIAPSGPPGSG